MSVEDVLDRCVALEVQHGRSLIERCQWTGFVEYATQHADRRQEAELLVIGVRGILRAAVLALPEAGSVLVAANAVDVPTVVKKIFRPFHSVAVVSSIIAVGDWSVTTADADFEPLPLSLSVTVTLTVTLTVKVPSSPYVWVALTLFPLTVAACKPVPSPQSTVAVCVSRSQDQ